MSTTDSKHVVRCAQCGALASAPNRRGGPNDPCEACGSRARVVEVTAAATVETHESAAIKMRRAGATGRPAMEGKYGDDFHRDSGEWRQRSMSVDRENDEYPERIARPDRTVVRDVVEPLSERARCRLR